MEEKALCEKCLQWRIITNHLSHPYDHCHHPKEVKPSQIRAGMKVRIRDGATIGQDMGFHKWIDDGTLFLVQNFNVSRKRLTAPGYGNPTPDYGNGAIYANDEDLIPTEEVQPCKCSYWLTRGEELKKCPKCGRSL